MRGIWKGLVTLKQKERDLRSGFPSQSDRNVNAKWLADFNIEDFEDRENEIMMQPHHVHSHKLQHREVCLQLLSYIATVLKEFVSKELLDHRVVRVRQSLVKKYFEHSGIAFASDVCCECA